MDISLREWLIIIGVLIILGVIIDGLRRMRLGRKDQLQMSRRLGGDLNKGSPLDAVAENPELPTHGFRVIRRGEDSARYAEAAKAYEQTHSHEQPGRVEPDFSDDTPRNDTSPDTDGRSDISPLDVGEPDRFDASSEADDRSRQIHASEDFEEDDQSRADETDEDDIIVDEPYDDDDAEIRHEPLMNDMEGPHGHLDKSDDTEQPLHAESGEDGRASIPRKARKKGAAKPDRSSVESVAAVPKEESRFKERFLQKMGPVRRMTEKVQLISRVKLQQRPAKPASKLQHLTVVNVVSRDIHGFDGATLDHILNAVGMQRTAQNTFVRHEDDFDEGEVQFTLVNAVEPGTFPDDMVSFRTPCIALVLALPGPLNSIQAFDYMIEIAQVIVKNCDGELLDADHSAMTSQTIEHHRQAIREYERKSMSVKA